MQSHATETNQILWFYSFFRFSIWKNYFQLSALPLFTLLRGPWQQTLRTAVYSQEFNKVNSVVRWKFRANLGQFCGRVRPHWKQIDVKRWGFIILSWNLQDLLHKVKEKRLKFLAIREKQFWNFLVTARMKLQGVTKKFHQYIKEKLTSNINAGNQ